MDLKCNIERVTLYNVTINGKVFYNFKIDGELEGIVKLLDDKDRMILINDEKNTLQNLFESVFGDIFGNDNKAAQMEVEYDVIKCNKDFLK